MSADRLSDGAARELARLDLNHNVVVEAGAGTGKTTILIDRILFLLLGRRREGPVEVGRVVALTFTEKAAAEIRARLCEKLNAVSSLLQGIPVPGRAGEAAAGFLAELKARGLAAGERTLELAQTALKDLDQAQICTIHSFCSHLLRLHPLEAGVDPEFTVDADGEAFRELFDSEWALWLDQELGESAPRPELWRRALERAPLGDLEELARGMANPRVDLAAALGQQGVAARLRALAADAAKLGQGRPKAAGRIEEYLSWLSLRLNACADTVEGRVWDCPPPPVQSAAWPKSWDEKDAAEYKSIERVAKRVSPVQEPLLRDCAALLTPFVESLRRAMRRRGLISFDGLLVAARDLLRDERRVRSSLKRRFDAILVDEFQDTDPLQGELLMFLAEAKDSSAARWQDARPEAGKLFVVGDPKQSIYRFRGADISAVESFTAHLERHGARRATLQTNFRSRAAIVDSVNRVFESAMRPAAGLQPSYIPIRAARGADGARPPAWVSPAVPEGGLPAAAARRAEAEWIARWIAAESATRPLGDIAVVLRSTSPLPAYLEALKRHDIRYVVEGEKNFFGTQEVVDLLNLLRAIDDPEDRAALAGLLRSPLASLEDREIYRLAQKGDLDYRKPVPGLEPFYARLRSLRARSRGLPVGEVVRAALAETWVLELCAAAYDHQQTVSNLLKFARLAAQAGERGRTLKEFIEATAAAAADLREEGESPLADEHLDAVRVLTIHKAKGLEYPVVILPNLGSAPAARGSESAVRAGWSAPAVGLRLLKAKAANAAMILLEEEEARRQKAEEVRVLYVAMTRPKETLVLLGAQGRGESFAALLEKACSGRQALERVEMELSELEPAPARRAAAAYPAADPARLAEAWRRRAARKQELERARLFRRPSEAPEDREEEKGRARGRAGDREKARLLGEACHRALERWDFKGGGDLDAALASAPPALRTEARRILAGFLSSKAARELARVEILGREVPFLFAEEGRVVRGAIDLLYRSGEKVVAVEFKTDDVSGARKALRRRRYESQGRLYAEAARRALGAKKAEFRVMFLRDP